MKFYTIKEIATNLKVSDQTVYNWISDGKLKALQVGGLLRVEEEEYLRFIGKNSTKKEA
jgi:excisionase family DNA binding protein